MFGLLGKNGVGKTTLIKIMMGFLRPTGGICRILGDDSHNLSPRTRRKVGLLFEGHLYYEFLSLEGIERFFAPFYPDWKKKFYYGLTDRLGLLWSHKIGQISEGQRSQMVLGLIMAQQPRVMILDDYNMGLDAGYRRLFLYHLAEYLQGGDITVLVTSHIVQDLERFVDEIIFLERGGGWPPSCRSMVSWKDSSSSLCQKRTETESARTAGSSKTWRNRARNCSSIPLRTVIRLFVI